jgi:enediyne biosynthesis protein E4
LINRVPERGGWIGLSCLEASGLDVIGARVAGKIAGQPFVRSVRAAASYQASSEPRIHIGLGSHSAVEELSVTWPDGSVEAFGTRPAGANHRLVRGQGEVR